MINYVVKLYNMLEVALSIYIPHEIAQDVVRHVINPTVSKMRWGSTTEAATAATTTQPATSKATL